MISKDEQTQRDQGIAQTTAQGAGNTMHDLVGNQLISDGLNSGPGFAGVAAKAAFESNNTMQQLLQHQDQSPAEASAADSLYAEAMKLGAGAFLGEPSFETMSMAMPNTAA
jgi:hypothetical protein